jgi:hypothetical protein
VYAAFLFSIPSALSTCSTSSSYSSLVKFTVRISTKSVFHHARVGCDETEDRDEDGICGFGSGRRKISQPRYITIMTGISMYKETKSTAEK